MATLCRRLGFLVLVICCVFLSANGERWRAILKSVRRCKGPKLVTDYSKPKITYSNRDNFFHVDAVVMVTRAVKLRKINVNVYEDAGARSVKLLTWTYADVCDAINKSDPYVDPIFAPGAFPRVCDCERQNITVHVDYDLHGEMESTVIRGPVVVEVKTYDDHDELIGCARFHGILKKDTLN